MSSTETIITYSLYILFLINSTNSAKLPSVFIKCNYNDSECLKKATKHALENLRNGNKELGLPSIDPFVIDTVTIGAGQKVDLVQNYKNFNLYGLSVVEDVEQFTIDVKNKKITLAIKMPVVTFNATYSVKGKLLLLDVYGDGPSSIKLDSVLMKMEMNIDAMKKSNDVFLKIINEKISLDAKHASYQYSNLFDGNEQLGLAINNVLNDNWREIFDDVNQKYADAIGTEAIKLINQVFGQIPIKELFPNHEDFIKNI